MKSNELVDIVKGDILIIGTQFDSDKKRLIKTEFVGKVVSNPHNQQRMLSCIFKSLSDEIQILRTNTIRENSVFINYGDLTVEEFIERYPEIWLQYGNR